jgi:predicted acyl esterase
VTAVAWAARQPWCTGAVGVWGFSYGALLALRTAARRGPGLRAAVALMPLLDPERDYVHPGGAPGCLNAQGMWAIGTFTNMLLPPLHAYHDPAEQRRWRERIATAEPYLLDLHRHPPEHPVWRTRALDLETIDVPVLCVGGTRDMFADATLRLYEGLRGPRKLLLGPWSHSLPSDAPVHPVGLAAISARWWDRWLRDEPNGVESEPPVTVYVQNGGWLDLDRLAPLAAPAPLQPETASRADDPTVGARGGLWGIPHGSGEPIDQHADDLRSATFIGPVVAEPMLLLGRPEVVVTGTADRVAVKLTDVDPDGRSRLISGGLVLVDADHPVWTVRLDPTAYRVPAGHRLRVVVAGASFPRVWPAASPVDAIAVSMALPLVAESTGTPAVVPEPPSGDVAGGWRWHEPQWEIRERPGHSLSLHLGESFAVRLPRAGVELESRISTTSTVRVDGSADLRGESLTIATLGTGERAVVMVELRLTPGTVWLHGSVSIDGHTIADRHWNI